MDLQDSTFKNYLNNWRAEYKVGEVKQTTGETAYYKLIGSWTKETNMSDGRYFRVIE